MNISWLFWNVLFKITLILRIIIDFNFNSIKFTKTIFFRCGF